MRPFFCAFRFIRITSANCGTAANQTFSYDPFGNISKSGSPYSFQPTYDTATNRFATVPGGTPSYLANGNVLSDGTHTYSWNADGDAYIVDNVFQRFDSLDRPVEQSIINCAPTCTYTQIVYSPSGAKLALMNGQTLKKAFIPLPGKATAVYTTGGLDHYRHSDWLGSARLTSTPSRTVSSTVAYAPFGETYAQFGTADLSFTGMNQDTTSGDYDFPARYYSTQGRWPSPDPAGLGAVDPFNPQSWNRYSYVLNNPLSAVDPKGLDCIYAADAPDNPSPGPNGTVTIVRGDCVNAGGKNDSGVFVDGTIDTSSPITSDPTTGDLHFGVSDENGAYGAGIAMNFYSPQPSDQLNGFALTVLGDVFARLRWLDPEVCGGGVFYLRGREFEAGPAHVGAFGMITWDSKSGYSAGRLVEGGLGPASVGREKSINLQTGKTDNSTLFLGGLSDHAGGFAGYTDKKSPIQIGAYAFAKKRGGGAYVNMVAGNRCN